MFKNETDDAVYNTSVSPLVAHALAGGASTVIAYGATGAGKTHSMTAVQRLAAAALLAQHAPEPHVRELATTLEQWCRLGFGCTVVSHRPPRLAGAVPQHLSVTWDRVPRLVEYGLLPGSP